MADGTHMLPRFEPSRTTSFSLPDGMVKFPQRSCEDSSRHTTSARGGSYVKLGTELPPSARYAAFRNRTVLLLPGAPSGVLHRMKVLFQKVTAHARGACSDGESAYRKRTWFCP